MIQVDRREREREREDMKVGRDWGFGEYLGSRAGELAVVVYTHIKLSMIISEIICIYVFKNINNLRDLCSVLKILKGKLQGKIVIK